MTYLSDLGFVAHFASHWQAYVRPGLRVGRVVQEQKGAYLVLAAPDVVSKVEPVWASLAGRLAHRSAGRADLPAVGDFVVLEGEGDGRARLAALLPRLTRMLRKASGQGSEEQVIAANVDTVFIMSSLNLDFSERRVERYLTAVWDGGALPVVLLSKADLASERDDLIARVRAVALGAPVHCVSVPAGEGLDQVRGYFAPGKSIAIVGSSGVGKSTLTNALMGRGAQSVSDVRDGDDKGRHTTTSRTLLMLPSGGMIVDTPGMREFMPSDDGDGVATVFEDLEAIAVRCRFTDCRHVDEPGCAIQAAIATGSLTPDRLASHRKLLREQAWLHRRQDAKAASDERKKWKRIHMEQRRHPKKSRG